MRDVMLAQLFTSLSAWDIGLMAVFAYLAITMLVRLMRVERDQLLDRFRREMLERQAQQQAAANAKKPADRAA